MPGFTVNSVVLKQQGHELYCFGMNSAQLKKICYVTPRSQDDPVEIQRILSPQRAKEIGQIHQGSEFAVAELARGFTDEGRNHSGDRN